ncbi:hypothetical protein D3C78_423990 [compost metagenome]
MTDFQRCQLAATAPACPEKCADLLTPNHLELIREAAQALHRATAAGPTTSVDMDAWLLAAERLAVALVSRLEAMEAMPCP